MQQKDNQQPKFVPDRDMKLMDQVSQVFRYRHHNYHFCPKMLLNFMVGKNENV